MLISEFEARTGFYPTLDLYRFIEASYMKSGLDKDAFCSAYKNNKNGLAEGIAREAILVDIISSNSAENTVSKLEKEIEYLKIQLEVEQEWKLCEKDLNVKQSDYERLATSSGARVLSDEEAKDLIAEEFGFDRSKINIRHSVEKTEINRRGRIRDAGEIGRPPIYKTEGSNYILFDCSHWRYEMHNGVIDRFYR